MTNPIILDPGVYDLTVVGYISDGGGGTVAVASNVLPVTVAIDAGKIAHKAIELRLLTDGSDDGTFTYTLDNTNITTADITTANMTITPISANGTGVQTISIKSQFGSGDTITLKNGIYSIEFTLQVGGDTVTFMHIVHIYIGLDSSYIFSIGLNYFNAIYQSGSGDITFSASDKNPTIEYCINPDPNPSNNTYISYTEGTIISLNRGDKIEFTITNSSIYTAGSFAWYCLSSTSRTSNATYTINTTLATYPAVNEFSSARDYNLTVTGVVNGENFYTLVKFSVTP
ncbi:hypothetical protein [Treponema sp. R6D11]